jgi:hypothetical protein
MKHFILLLSATLLTIFCGAQDLSTDSSKITIEPITATKLLDMQKQSGNCMLAVIWVPNCKTAGEQFKEFAAFQKSVDYPVFFIGITNKPELIETIAQNNKYSGTLYMIDTAVCADIYKRFDVFCDQLSRQLKTKTGKTFNTLFLDRKGQVVVKKDLMDFSDWLKTACK